MRQGKAGPVSAWLGREGSPPGNRLLERRRTESPERLIDNKAADIAKYCIRCCGSDRSGRSRSTTRCLIQRRCCWTYRWCIRGSDAGMAHRDIGVRVNRDDVTAE